MTNKKSIHLVARQRKGDDTGGRRKVPRKKRNRKKKERGPGAPEKSKGKKNTRLNVEKKKMVWEKKMRRQKNVLKGNGSNGKKSFDPGCPG